MRSPLLRSMSTRAYFAAPWVFLYADSRASSSADIRRSEEIPFSRSRTRTASRISLLMRSALQQVASVDVRVRDGHDARVGSHRDLAVARSDELAREGLAPVVVLARAHTRATTHEATEVLRLGERSLGTGRRNLQRVVHEQIAQMTRDPLAERQVDSVRMVDEHPHLSWGDLLHEQHVDVGLNACEPLLDVLLCSFQRSPSGRKKGGPPKPTPRAAHGRR